MGYAVTGSSLLGTTSLILLILIKVLFVLFIIGLVVGIALAIKNYIFTEEDVKRIKCSLSGNKAKEKHICSACGKELGNQWIACPYCGNEIEKEVA
ncbi:MAG TPA: zinc ribbon domain-containing protein [Patescibacteria group bacterium]|nr:zinc ribbon domain-containing protein [Patescibacteria group bacterium]